MCDTLKNILLLYYYYYQYMSIFNTLGVCWDISMVYTGVSLCKMSIYMGIGPGI